MKVILMMVVTADGKIAKTSEHFPDWSSKEDKKMFRQISKDIGVIIMGRNTYETLPAPLPGRLHIVFSSNRDRREESGVKWVSDEPEKVLKELEEAGHDRALLCGGAGINTLFLEKKLIDEIIVNIEPIIFGSGLGIFNGDFNANLELLSLEKLNENAISLRYRVVK